MPKTSLEGSTIRVDLNEEGPSLTRDQLDSFLEEGRGTFTTEELAKAFEDVKDKEHWKNPIDAVVPLGQKDVLEKAIPWYTGTEPTFYDIDKEGYLRVTAPGYFAGPCN